MTSRTMVARIGTPSSNATGCFLAHRRERGRG
jgi:hypothetical protein